MTADCPDCGRVVLFRNRCPQCGGDSWQRPNGIPEQAARRMPWIKRMKLVVPKVLRKVGSR